MSAPRPRVFIGSSSEGLDVARNLSVELDDSICEVVPWHHNVFKPSGFTLPTLLDQASTADFAVLIATPDDTTVSRDERTASPRDNVVLEFGLFAGALGLDRTYLLATGDLKLPTDVLGLTRLSYRKRADDARGAVREAALQVEERVKSLGRFPRAAVGPDGVVAVRSSLDHELDLLCGNAVAQGWTVKTNSRTTLRLRTPRGKTLTLPKRQPEVTREDLREFTARLRAEGLRVNTSLRRPVMESPL